jgi:hypothetical protein
VRRTAFAAVVVVLAFGVVANGPVASAALAPKCSAPFEGVEARCEFASDGFPVSLAASYRAPHPSDHIVLHASVTAVLTNGSSFLLFTCAGQGRGQARCAARQYEDWSALQVPVPEEAVKLICSGAIENHGSGVHSHASAKHAKAAGKTSCASGVAAS